MDAAWVRRIFHTLGAGGAVIRGETPLGALPEANDKGLEFRTRRDIEKAKIWPLLGVGSPFRGSVDVALTALRSALPFRVHEISDLMWHPEVVALIDGVDFRYGHPLFIRDFLPVLKGEIPALNPGIRRDELGPSVFRGCRCELCGDDLPDNTEVRHIVGISRIVRCRRCGLEYDNPQAIIPDAAFDKYASDNELRNGRAPTADRAATNATAIMAFLREHDREPVGTRLLDVGCASGEILQLLASEHRWELNSLTGIDPSRKCTEIAVQRHSLRAIRSTAEDAELPAASFDVILVINTMEHLPAPAKALANLRSWLRPGGTLILGNIPNTDCLMGRLEPCRFIDKNFSDGEHHFHYTPTTLAKLCEHSGFQVDKITGRQQDITGSLVRETAAWIAYGCGVSLDACTDEHAMLETLRERVTSAAGDNVMDLPQPLISESWPSNASALVELWRGAVWSDPRYSETFWMLLS